MATLILGMGNSIASDDAVGLIVAEQLKRRIDNPDIHVKTLECGGLAILDVMQGYDSAIVIDAIKTGKHAPGSILRFEVEAFDFTPRSARVHDVGFFQALELGRRFGMDIPRRVNIVSIEIVENRMVSETLTAPVEAAVEPAVQQVLSMLRDDGS